MKLLACGDFHLGAGADLGARPGDRLADQERVLERILDVAREEDFFVDDHVLVAGDVFHRRTPTPAEILIWQEFVYNVNNEFGSTVTVTGNHDIASADLPIGIELAPGGCWSRHPELIALNGHLRTHLNDNHFYDGPPKPGEENNVLTVATLPWVPSARFVASRNGEGREALAETVATLLVDAARDLRAQIEGRAVLLTHWSISGASLPNGLPVEQLREPILPLSELVELGFEAVIAGHIHKPDVLNEDPLVLYTGSPACVDFGEAHVDHGVWLIDMKTPGAIEHRFVPIEDRRFVTVDCDLTLERSVEQHIGGDDETDRIAAAIAEHFPLTDAVVRIRYRATSEQARRVDVAALRALCADAGVSKVFQIIPEIERTDRARVEGLTEQVSVPEALDLYLGAQDPPVEAGRAEALRTLNAELLDEVIA